VKSYFICLVDAPVKVWQQHGIKKICTLNPAANIST